MTSSSRLELIISTSEAERSLRRLEGRLNSADRAGESISTSMTTVERRLAGVERFARAASGAFLGLSTGAGVFTAIARSASQSAAEIDNLSRLANTNVEDFQRLSFASRAYGVEQDKLADILKDTNDRVGDFLSTGGGEMKDFFEQIAPQIGVTAEEFRNLSGPQALQKYYDGLQAANLSQAEMTFYMESVADEATALIPLLRDGGAEMDRLGQEADDLNAILSQMEIQRLKDIRGEFGQLGQQLSTETMRAVSQFDDLMKSSLEGISYGINNVARGFNVFMDSFRDGEAKRSIAGIDAELNALFDTKARLEQRIDMFGADSPQAQDTIAALGELRGEYTALIDRKKELQQAGLPVTEPEIVQLGRVSTEIDKQAEAAKGSAKEVTDLADAHESLLDRITPNRREARQYAQDLGVLNLALASGRMNTQEYMQAMGMLQESFQDAQRDTDELADKTQDAAFSMEKSFDELRLNGLRRLDDGLADLWQGAIDGSLNATDIMKRAFEQTLAEMAHMAITRPIVVQMQSMMGMGGGQAGGQSGGFNLGSMGSVKNAWGAVQNGFGGIQWAGAPTSYSGGFAGSATSGMSVTSQGTSYLGGSTANFGGMTGLASAGTGFAGGWAGGQVFGESEAQQIGATIGTVAGTYLGGPIGAAIGSFLGSGVGSIFGHEETPFSGRFGTTGSVTPGTFEHQGSTSEQFYSESALGAVGFMDDGTERLQRAGTGSKEWAEQLAAGTAQIDNLVASLAQGAPELDAMRSAVQGLEISSRNAGEIIEFALNERPRAALEALGGHFGAFVRGLEGGIESVVQQAQVAQQAHSLLAGGMDRLNLQFDAAGAGAYEAASALAEYAGNIENIAAINDAYYQAAFSNEERLQHSHEDVRTALNSLTDANITSVAHLRQLVEAQDLNSEAGAQLAYDLMSLAPALRESNQAVKEAINQQYQSALGREADADGLAYWFNQVTNGGLTLEGALWNIRNAAQSAAGAVDSTSGALNSYVTHAVSDSLDAYNDQISSIEELSSARREQLNNEMRAVDQLGSLIDSLALSNQSILDPAERLAEAQRQFAELQVRAENGDTEAAGQLQGASTAYLDAAAAYYGQSSSQYESIFGDVNQGIGDLEQQFGQSVDSLGSIESIEQRALREQQNAHNTLMRSLDEQISASGELSTIGDLLSALPGELANALEGIVSSGGGDSGGEGGSSSSYINNTYNELFGRDADAEGASYWESTGLRGNDLRDAIEHSAWKDNAFATGGAFTNGVVDRPTSFPMGLMGEAGPEAIMPLSNVGGSLGVRAVMPPLPDFPSLNTQDVTQVMRDMQRTIQQQGQQITQLLQQGNQNTAQTRDAVVGIGKQASQQQGQQVAELRKINKNVKLKVATI